MKSELTIKHKKTNIKQSKSNSKSKDTAHNANNTNNDIKHKQIKNKITRKVVRQFEIDRVSKIAKLIPLFTKFYNKFSNDELIALKYYKGSGSYWQTKFLTN